MLVCGRMRGVLMNLITDRQADRGLSEWKKLSAFL